MVQVGGSWTSAGRGQSLLTRRAPGSWPCLKDLSVSMSPRERCDRNRSVERPLGVAFWSYHLSHFTVYSVRERGYQVKKTSAQVGSKKDSYCLRVC